MSSCPKQARHLEVLVGQYDICNLQAHSAYMQGRGDIAAEFYRRAFLLSAEMLTLTEISSLSIERCVESCLNCFEYSEAPLDDDEYHYIDVAGERLVDIVSGGFSDKLRVCALSAFAEIAHLAYQLTRCSDSEKSRAVFRQFNKLWPIYSVQLIEPH